MKIARAHSYRACEDVKHELARMPSHWLKAIDHIQWFILPDDLRPTYIGLMERDGDTNDGRRYDTLGGWFCGSDVVSRNWRWKPHIYLCHSSAWAAVHEAAHALAEVWNPPIQRFFKPVNAFYDYMATSPDEYFACTIDAFLTPTCDGQWGPEDLAVRNWDLFKFLESKQMTVV